LKRANGGGGVIKSTVQKIGTNSALIVPPQSSSGSNALAGDIHGIKAPVDIPSGYAWVWWTLAIIAAAALGYWLYRKWRAKLAAPKPVVIVPPHRKAKDKLRSALELMSDPYAFCSLVSDVVRVYLEERFELHAPDRTTEEFLDEVRYSPKLDQTQKDLLQNFLNRCDLVKFARYEPTQEELKELYDSALRLIDETSPLAEAPAVAA
jgi:hypothetical protein